VNSKPLLERAFELARSGDCVGTGEVRARLKAEGYEMIDAALWGPALRQQLKVLLRESSTGSSERLDSGSFARRLCEGQAASDDGRIIKASLALI
jgi:hypothetical protein